MNADFAHALLDSGGACPPGLVAWNGSDPGRRFNVYRNNVLVGLVDALADSFPVTQELVGEDFFRAMAREFALHAPPVSPVLAMYGTGFPEFIAGFAPATSVPFLSDMARLELLRVQAFHAADADPVDAGALARVLSDPALLPMARLELHPALRLVASKHPVVSIWAAHQSDAAECSLPGLDMAQAEVALLCRKDLEVEMFRIDEGTFSLVTGLQHGMAFGAAANLALDHAPQFELPVALALLLRTGALTGIHLPRSTTT